MSALSEASTPAQDAASAIDAQQLHQLQEVQQNNNGTEGTIRKGWLTRNHIVQSLKNIPSQSTVRQACVYGLSYRKDKV